MPIELLMPALSPTMTEGNLAKWHKKEGDPVKAGDIIAEIETDKATMEFEAVDEGTLGKILVPEGAEGVKVNQPIALLLEEGEDKSALDKAAPAAKPAAPPPKAEPAKPATPAASKPAPAPEAPKTTPPPPQRAAAPPPAAARGNGHAAGERIFASPLARRMAEKAGIDIARLTGSGPHGRIIKSDIEAALTKGPAALKAPAARAPAAPGAPITLPSYSRDQVVALAGNPPFTEVPLSNMRRIIAKRMQEAKATIPHFYLTVDCEIDALLRMRKEINEAADLKLSLNDFVIKAAALTLKKVPAVNASFSEEAILRWESADIAVAVALEEGLITPIIKSAEKKGLGQISTEMKDLSARARAGKLKLTEFQGGTFSISNLGMYGIKDFTAVINPPHSAILAVGAGEQRPVVKNGALAIATVMSCTLACDHRAVDGATGAQWLQAFKKIIEAPGMLAL
ncbi:MAG TPA: pyruvate dehydrogenase complex dihydrolipoamide acetyltransferase [Stellaceae bacterium]|nr:pyruvate dehydrogenase complex dihydrolipoamide acetyltransferase [Stellaceae bacterium]